MKAKTLIDKHDLFIIQKLNLNKEMLSLDLYDYLKLKSYCNFSQHIKKLINLGFIIKIKRGNQRILSLTEKGEILIEAFS